MIFPARMYPAFFVEDEGAFVVTFRDIPEALTQGDDLIDAVVMAMDCLHVSREFYLEDGRKMAEPSPALPGEVLIPLYLLNLEEQVKLFYTEEVSA